MIIPAPITTQWNSPLTTSVKKGLDGQVDPKKRRVCMDTRALNDLLKPNEYTIPKIAELLESLGGYKIFSTIDLESAFHKLPVAQEDQQKLTFTHRRRKYMFVGAPFGLKILTQVFQRVIEYVLRETTARTFVDDIVQGDSGVEEHIQSLRHLI